MESLGYAWHNERSRRALLGNPSRFQTSEATPARRFDKEKRKTIGEEVHKHLTAGFIKEVY